MPPVKAKPPKGPTVWVVCDIDRGCIVGVYETEKMARAFGAATEYSEVTEAEVKGRDWLMAEFID